MKDNNVVDLRNPLEFTDTLTELLRSVARELISQAVEAELSAFMDQFSGRLMPDKRAAVVRNGYHPERKIQTGIGPVSVKIPKVRSKDGSPVSFQSVLVPPYVRKNRSFQAALPWLYLKGVSTGEMSSALAVLVGDEAKGFSAGTVSR